MTLEQVNQKLSTQLYRVSRILLGGGEDDRDDSVTFVFDGEALRITDNPSCCETRYFRFENDDRKMVLGSILLGIEVVECDSIPAAYGDHDVQQFVLRTTNGVYVMSSHNEHSGYYGGFNLHYEWNTTIPQDVGE